MNWKVCSIFCFCVFCCRYHWSIIAVNGNGVYMHVYCGFKKYSIICALCGVCGCHKSHWQKYDEKAASKCVWVYSNVFSHSFNAIKFYGYRFMWICVECGKVLLMPLLKQVVFVCFSLPGTSSQSNRFFLVRLVFLMFFV